MQRASDTILRIAEGERFTQRLSIPTTCGPSRRTRMHIVAYSGLARPTAAIAARA